MNGFLFLYGWVSFPTTPGYTYIHTERKRENETDLSTQRDVTRLDAKGEKKKEIHREAEGVNPPGKSNVLLSESLALSMYMYIFCKYISYIYNIEISSDITLMLYNVRLSF